MNIEKIQTKAYQQNNKCILDIETTSFQPWSGRIICIGTKDVDNGEVRVLQDDHEETLLLQFFQYFNKRISAKSSDSTFPLTHVTSSPNA